MNKKLLVKIGSSLLALFLMAACNNGEETDQESPNTEEETEAEGNEAESNEAEENNEEVAE